MDFGSASSDVSAEINLTSVLRCTSSSAAISSDRDTGNAQDDMTDPQSSLDDEIELITASLLPTEELIPPDKGSWPRITDITSTDSKLSLRVQVDADYPSVSAVHVEIRGDLDRDEAEEWKRWTGERMLDWQASDGYASQPSCRLY